MRMTWMGFIWPVSPNIVVGPQGRKPFFPAHSSGAVTSSLFQSPTSPFQSLVLIAHYRYDNVWLSCTLKILRVLSKGKSILQCICETWGKVKCLIFSVWVQFHETFIPYMYAKCGSEPSEMCHILLPTHKYILAMMQPKLVWDICLLPTQNVHFGQV